MSTETSPTSGSRRQIALRGVLVVVLAFAGWYYYWPTTATPLASEPVPVTKAADKDELPVPEPVRLTALSEASELGEAGRNPFSYGVRPPPPAPPRPPAPPPAPPAPVGPPPVVGPPPIGLRLIGLTTLGAGGRTVATLKDPVSNAVFNAFEGDIVDGRYRVVKVGLQSVTLSYVDGSGVKLVGLGG